ncbi:hypothetical protein KY345_04510 [Candidatus Woesearchaeota archaeon]|nr:hypothetical protein [Candidatus Woesearchaeota archaeon]
MKNALYTILIGTSAIASPLSDKLGEVRDYLAGQGFQVQENQERYFTDTSYSFPLLIEESDSNIDAGMKDMLVSIDTLADASKRQAVEENLGLYIIIGAGTDPDSVYRAVRHEPPTRKIPRKSFTKKHEYTPKGNFNLRGQKIDPKYMRKQHFKPYFVRH